MRYFELLEESKNTHLEHVEDEVLNLGREGAIRALAILSGLYEMLTGHSAKSLNLSVKWDGSPSIICGIDPDSKKFFVGTKSVFSAKPKLNFTNQDIKLNHGHVAGLSEKLEVALQYLPSLGIKGVLQGDFLFDKSDLNEITIDGTKCISFKPNTITYAIPSESNLAKEVARAKIGIVFHTEYTGKSLNQMHAQFKPVVNLTHTPSVWLADATYKDVSGSATLTEQEGNAILSLLSAAKKEFSKIPVSAWNALKAKDTFSELFKRFINAKIREGKLDTNPNTLLDEFVKFFEKMLQTEISKLANQSSEAKAVKARHQKLSDMQAFIKEHRKELYAIISFFVDIAKIKDVFIKKLNQAEHLQAFIENANGELEVTAPEGFVAVDRMGNAVKLVDRLTFSQANFRNNLR